MLPRRQARFNANGDELHVVRSTHEKEGPDTPGLTSEAADGVRPRHPARRPFDQRPLPGVPFPFHGRVGGASRSASGGIEQRPRRNPDHSAVQFDSAFLGHS